MAPRTLRGVPAALPPELPRSVSHSRRDLWGRCPLGTPYIIQAVWRLKCVWCPRNSDANCVLAFTKSAGFSSARDVALNDGLPAHRDSDSVFFIFADLGHRKALRGRIEYQAGTLDGNSTASRLSSAQPPRQGWQAVFNQEPVRNVAGLPKNGIDRQVPMLTIPSALEHELCRAQAGLASRAVCRIDDGVRPFLHQHPLKP
jgi:hypothetical protein